MQWLGNKEKFFVHLHFCNILESLETEHTFPLKASAIIESVTTIAQMFCWWVQLPRSQSMNHDIRISYHTAIGRFQPSAQSQPTSSSPIVNHWHLRENSDDKYQLLVDQNRSNVGTVYVTAIFNYAILTPTMLRFKILQQSTYTAQLSSYFWDFKVNSPKKKKIQLLAITMSKLDRWQFAESHFATKNTVW